LISPYIRRVLARSLHHSFTAVRNVSLSNDTQAFPDHPANAVRQDAAFTTIGHDSVQTQVDRHADMIVCAMGSRGTWWVILDRDSSQPRAFGLINSVIDETLFRKSVSFVAALYRTWVLGIK
jgi:hypothetical protein